MQVTFSLALALGLALAVGLAPTGADPTTDTVIPEALMMQEDSGSFLLDNPEQLLEPKVRQTLQRIFDHPDRDNLLLQVEASGAVDTAIESYVKKPCASGIHRAMANPNVHKVVEKLVEANNQTPEETCEQLVPTAEAIMTEKAKAKGMMARMVVKKLLDLGLKKKMTEACIKGLTNLKAVAGRVKEAAKNAIEKHTGIKTLLVQDSDDDSQGLDYDSDNDVELLSIFGRRRQSSRRRSSRRRKSKSAPSPPPGPVSPLTTEVTDKVCGPLVEYVKEAFKQATSKAFSMFGR